VQAVAGNSANAPGVKGADIAGAEPWHRGASGNNLRAAVLGANDGLVSNFCLIMGVAGAGTSGKTVLLTGMAGLIAGACSMALGEWLSVTNARELARTQIDKEAEESRRRRHLWRWQDPGRVTVLSDRRDDVTPSPLAGGYYGLDRCSPLDDTGRSGTIPSRYVATAFQSPRRAPSAT